MRFSPEPFALVNHQLEELLRAVEIPANEIAAIRIVPPESN
jgi:hypothetical protein